jgi:hypothetical protein
MFSSMSLAGCAKKGAPTGGPPDLEPPRVISTVPDSGAAGVSRQPLIRIEFSEGMEPRSSSDAIELLPSVEIKQRRWSGNVLSLVLKDSLKADRTYTMYAGGGARDRHGNNIARQRTVVFTTAATFPPGMLEGRVDAVGFAAPNAMLWCYRDGHMPDSTAKDFDALGITDATGHFRVAGIPPGVWKVWTFVDLNRNRSYEPDQDLLVPADSAITLTAAQPVKSGLVFKVVNPKAPGRFAGSVLDSVSDGSGVTRLIVASLSDTTRRLLYDIPANGSFDFKFDPGPYHIRAFRDLDRNKSWKRDSEPASSEILVTITPGGDLHEVLFVLIRAALETARAAPGAAPPDSLQPDSLRTPEKK